MEDLDKSFSKNSARDPRRNRMAEIFELLKELTTSRAAAKVLIREETKSSIIKNVNSISLARGEEERNDTDDIAADDGINRIDTEMPVKEAEKENEAEMEPKTNQLKELKENKQRRHPALSPFNDSISGVRVGKMKGKTYNLLPRGPVYEAILRKKITRKEDIEGNFEIPCNIGGPKCMNALVDQGSDPLVYLPLGIAEDVLVEVAEHVYPVDFVILDIKEDERRPFILGTPFLKMAKVVIKFDKGTITLRSGKSKISFHRRPKSLCNVEKGIKNDIEPIAPTMTVNRIVLEWEERIKLHLEREMKFDQWRSKNFKSKHPALVKIEGEIDDEGEVT
ncbi:zinc finger, CCHC-type containing protein [Tanacetum coccineum]|uniref:Zinc finger, CCHC-type containing protein n=1 Tax=Tanacetum coccineum TaxID=301880 RepID=A0ABQ4XT70_9ASTR